MGHQSLQTSSQRAWAMARRQHGVLTRGQLLDLGFSAEAIKHRVGAGRLHAVHRGVYAVGRPQLTREGKWMAAVLSCGPAATLSHSSAAALWGIRPVSRAIEVTVPASIARQRKGIVVHRRASLTAADVSLHAQIPTTTPICTLIDIATFLRSGPLEAAINKADKLDLVDPQGLREALTDIVKRPGVRLLRQVLDRSTFTLTASELERRFLSLVRQAGLPKPLTGAHVNGFEVDFWWPDLGLVVETDGLRYHRTPAQQARDLLRDQAHAASGITPLRFTHAQVRYAPADVIQTLRAVVTAGGRTRTARGRRRSSSARGHRRRRRRSARDAPS
jgi:very-short-patch-repair endonuclease